MCYTIVEGINTNIIKVHSQMSLEVNCQGHNTFYPQKGPKENIFNTLFCWLTAELLIS